MYTNKTVALLLLLLSFLPIKGSTIIHNGDIETLTMVDGINNNTVYHVNSEEKGYIWMATDMGISRYDGFRFRNYPYTPANTTQEASAKLLPCAVHKIYPNNDGLLFLLLSNGSIACFDTEKEQYLPVHFSKPTGKINSIYLAEKYIPYFATSQGLYNAEVKRTNDDQEEAIQIKLSEKPLEKGNISLLCGDDKGSLFYCVDKTKVVHYSMGTHQVTIINSEKNTNTEVSALYVDDHHLWIARPTEHIAFYDYKRKTLRTLFEVNSEGLPISEAHVTDFDKTNEYTFYCSTLQGLYRIKFNEKLICDSPYYIEFVPLPTPTTRMPIEEKMTNLLWDKEQNTFWIGTFGGGAVKFDLNKEIHSRVARQAVSGITGIEEDAKGCVWLTTKQKGVWRSTSNVMNTASTFAPYTQGINSSESYRIYKDKNGSIWLGNERAEIVCINPFTGENQSYTLAPAETDNFIGEIRRFCMDSRDRMWIATKQGVVLLDYKNNKSSLAIAPGDEVKEITTIAEDKEGDIWVGTDNGVKRLEAENGKYSLTGNYEHQVGMLANAVSSIYVNSFNQIFVSYADKVIRIDGREKNKVETLYTLNDGLSSSHILCMVDDRSKNTWVGTNSGILTIRNDRSDFHSYSLSGYCNNVCRLHDGRLLWSDSQGLFFFDPMGIKNRREKAQFVLTDLWINGQSVSAGEEVNGQTILHSSPHNQKEFTFDAANNDFCFYFSDMQHQPMQRNIAYRLLPDEEWRLCALKDGIHFSNLKSGAYTLQAKLIYADADESEVLEIPIRIKADWGQTAWNIIISLLLLCGVACFAFYLYLLHKKRVKSIDKHEEANKVRNIVAARFIEEMRTPLSLIISPLREGLQEKGLSKGLSTKMLIAYRNSMGLLNSCDQLLTIFSYAPAKQVQLAPYSITKLTDSIVFSINEFLRVHPIEFQYEKKIKTDLEVWIDKKALNLVLQNMLTNAFMHTRHAGAIALILQETVEEEVHYCVLSVVDNGKARVRAIEEFGTNYKLLEKIDPTEVELGYSVMQEIMARHHGSISLENLKGNRTKVQIKFPISKSTFEADTNVVFVSPEVETEPILSKQGSPVKSYQSDEKLTLSETEQTLPNYNVDQTKKTLLIVEDYEDIRLYLKTLFEKEYNILLAVNGNEGVAIAKQELPDLIISDIMMPEKDGYECCREVKEGLDTCHIPVILLTAKVEDEDIIKGLEIGADDYVLKPFTPKILKAKVKNLIEGRMYLKSTYTHLLVTPTEEDTTQPDNNETETGIEDPFISTVVKIVEENMREPDFSVKKLAADLNMSQPTLYRKVKQCTDFTIIELIRGVRMKKAATLLKKRIYQVQEVAEMVGYNDIPTFRKHFVDTYGTPPSNFADSKVV